MFVGHGDWKHEALGDAESTGSGHQILETTGQSRGMHTAHLLTLSPACTAQGGVCLWSRGVSASGPVGCIPACNEADPPPPVDRQAPVNRSVWCHTTYSSVTVIIIFRAYAGVSGP